MSMTKHFKCLVGSDLEMMGVNVMECLATSCWQLCFQFTSKVMLVCINPNHDKEVVTGLKLTCHSVLGLLTVLNLWMDGLRSFGLLCVYVQKTTDNPLTPVIMSMSTDIPMLHSEDMFPMQLSDLNHEKSLNDADATLSPLLIWLCLEVVLRRRRQKGK